MAKHYVIVDVKLPYMKDVKLKAATVMTKNTIVLFENGFTIRTILSAFFAFKLKHLYVHLVVSRVYDLFNQYLN